MRFLNGIFKKGEKQHESRTEPVLAPDQTKRAASEAASSSGNAIAELDRAASLYAEQLERAANSIGYSVKMTPMQGGEYKP